MDGSDKKYKLGLVLSGGAARGFAHVGVIKALQELGIQPDIISGVSAGAIVGAFFASNFSADDILKIFNNSRLVNFIAPSLNGTSFVQPKGLQKILEENLKVSSFNELDIPLHIGATDFNQGKSVYFNEGPLIDKIIASASIPVPFPPVEINGSLFLDGGILDNMPFKPLEGKCEHTIGVHVNPTGHIKQADGIKDIAERTFHLVVSSDIQVKKHLFSLFIEPEELVHYGVMEVSKGEEMYEIGYQKAKQVFEKEKDMIKSFME